MILLFCAISSALGSKVAKSADNDDQNIFFFIKSSWVARKAEFHAYVRLVKKTARTFTAKKLSSIKDKKNGVF